MNALKKKKKKKGPIVLQENDIAKVQIQCRLAKLFFCPNQTNH